MLQVSELLDDVHADWQGICPAGYLDADLKACAVMHKTLEPFWTVRPSERLNPLLRQCRRRGGLAAGEAAAVPGVADGADAAGRAAAAARLPGLLALQRPGHPGAAGPAQAAARQVPCSS